MKQIHVAAAVIKNAQGEILLALRPNDKHQGGLWEFPGGKVEQGETVQEALKRELQEEVGIQVTKCRPLIQISHRYPDKAVLLDVFLVSEFEGQAEGCEGQAICWTTADGLSDFSFPAANQPIVDACQLPESILITGEFESPQACIERVMLGLSRGAQSVMLRSQHPAKLEIAAELKTLCESHDKLFILNGTPEEAAALKVDALHLSSHQLDQLADRNAFAGKWLSASCHTPEELEVAVAKGLDFVTLSPVSATQSHPNAAPLGWACFSDWVLSVPMPVYALGGMNHADISTAFAHGAQGIAAISAWWD
ncbi:Nudix family hydrolase [Neptuniibacter sp. CAU 1671]|uniref:Nudix family hydrolase n=1 Tax=Neptuniibacter sp. CAU 1671 TaxID=3032593 RepID=UPI0023DA447F|nr:Nudix family hydrolase [Neptuniibacter sp. CAU 1671]MDF2181549.1 Nudix family hydrolase [Neptuniibacter sp. CAU 1671]